MDDAVQTVMAQCKLWNDNNDMRHKKNVVEFPNNFSYVNENRCVMMVAEERMRYGK